MRFWQWHQEQVRGIRENYVRLILFGKSLLFFIVGSYFSIQLVQFGYFILILSTFLILNYFIGAVLDWYRRHTIHYTSLMFGFSGMLLLLLFLGIQSPQFPYKLVVLIIGIILTIPGMIDFVRGLAK